MPDAELLGRAFLRVTAHDDPRVLGLIASALGEEGVALDSIVAREQTGTFAGLTSVVVLTRPASEAALSLALERISSHSEITEAPRLIRIEEEV